MCCHTLQFLYLSAEDSALYCVFIPKAFSLTQAGFSDTPDQNSIIWISKAYWSSAVPQLPKGALCFLPVAATKRGKCAVLSKTVTQT